MCAGRIMTTHAGSLPRPTRLAELLSARSRGEDVDGDELDDAVGTATATAVARQISTGIDVVNDGEQGRESFFTYVRWRMTGFGGTSRRTLMADLTDHPGFLDMKLADWRRDQVSLMRAPAAVGPVSYTGRGVLAAELARFEAACAGHEPVDTFVTAPSPGIVAAAMTNRHYPSDTEYVHAVAAALATEYRAVLDAGHVLQIDAPDLAMERHTSFADRPLADFVAFCEVVLGAIDGALAGVARDRVRLHVCWGNYEGPHTRDVGLAEILPTLLALDCGGLVLSMANPRHAHEHSVLAAHGLPDRTTLVAGVVDTTTNYVEHPEVVAQRIETAVAAVGDPARVVAGTDCGFATAAGIGDVDPDVAWEKLAALVEGARLASGRIFGQ
jgi:5-methyltetrahydropteroyltriglutamate--homocysteine methyltransferase